jgi:hypothetical protein
MLDPTTMAVVKLARRRRAFEIMVVDGIILYYVILIPTKNV